MATEAQKILEESSVGKLPALPHILLKLLESSYDTNFDFTELAKTIQQDGALCSRVLTVASSPVYGQKKQAASFDQILVRLGINVVRTVTTTAVVQQFFSRFSSERTFFLKSLWHHSLSCALIGKELAKLTGYTQPDEAYLAGLLHDVGQLMLESTPNDAKKNPYESRLSDNKLLILEQDLYGIRHNEIGALMVENWNTDNFISDAIRYHHEPAEQLLDAHQLIKITHLADLLSQNDQLENGVAFKSADILFGLDKTLLLEVLERTSADIEATAASMDIDLKKNAEADEQKQIELAETVRNIALLDSARQNLSNAATRHDILQSAQQDANILFGIKNSLVFLCDPETQRLIGTSLHGNEPLDSLSIAMEPNRSLICDALINKTQTTSDGDDTTQMLSVIDRQILGLLHTHDMLCLPLISADTKIGALVLGISHEQKSHLARQKTLFGMFANVISSSLKTQSQLDEDRLEQQITDSNFFKAETNKIAHEANNPLNIMGNYLSILGMKLDDEHPAQSDLQVIKEEIDRVGKILLRLRDIPTQSPSSSDESVNINEVITQLGKLFTASLFSTRNITLELDLKDSLPELALSRNAFKQIITNLMKNTAEAMPDGGTIRVRTQDHINVNGKEYVEIKLIDNGPGIPADIKAKIFTPVTSTKGEGHSGVGLAIVGNLVKEFNGTITCKSNHTGTAFYILLPRTVNTEREQ